MKQFARCRKYTLCLILSLGSLQISWAAQLGVYQHGAVVRMRMGDCLPVHHGFLVAFGGAAAQMAAEACPEYTLVSDKVVFVIVGRLSDQFVPLADTVDFCFHNNELVMRIDDARHESRFGIKEMVLRSEWDLVQKHLREQLSTPTNVSDTPVMRTGD